MTVTIRYFLGLTGVSAPAADGIEPATSSRSSISCLTHALVAGNEEAFRELHACYFDRLLRYHLVLARGDEQIARDGLQETFVRIATKPRVVEDEPALWNWMAKIARNVAIDAHRRRLSYWKLLTRYTFFFDHPERTPDVDCDTTLHQILEASLNALDPADCALIRGKYFNRLPVRELARQCGLTEKCIESRLLRARRVLRDSILRQLRDERTA